jgi:hypothetical protein
MSRGSGARLFLERHDQSSIAPRNQTPTNPSLFSHKYKMPKNEKTKKMKKRKTQKTAINTKDKKFFM